MRLHAEFTSEPFVAGDGAPAHATKPVDVAQAAGLDTDFGPFGTSVAGDGRELLAALGEVLSAAFEHGATRVTLRVERVDG
ncbi:MAG TPA: thiamine-binding protein [Nocardioidaceae bacterium]|jgi:uncharacterized protein YqgV (UPF0045/DUF77 family)|nr:thiamine-binding protein [Nocardioidaceae bacterium]